ncbi:MAG TPA: hypothetical protein VGC42_07215 [Kofleriaceae bacterium]
MRRSWIGVLAGVLAACGSSGSGGGDPSTLVTLTLTSGSVDVVAYRSDADDAWQTARKTSATTYELDVAGPYWLAVSCQAHADDPNRVYRSLTQYGRTLDDPHQLAEAFCADDDAPPAMVHATGTMVRPGQIAMTQPERSATAGWSFDQPAVPGTYTLYAASADHVLALRDLDVHARLELPAIDVDANGTALTPMAFTITNPGLADKTEVAVAIQDASLQLPPIDAPTDLPLYVYIGAPAQAMVIPSSALAAHDAQTVSVREYVTGPAGKFSSSRSYRKPYHVGDDTAVTLPEQIGVLTWLTNDDDVEVSWKSIPANMPFWFDVQGASTSGLPRNYSMDVSAAFLATTTEIPLRFATDLPGGQPDWRVDFSTAYSLDAIGQIHGDLAVDPVISVTEQISSSGTPTAAPRRSLAR